MTTSYTYDVLGQLVRVDDGQEGATWEYEYDQGGNILSKKKYVDGVLVDSKTFTYGNPNWRDQLTAVNGVAITYDAIGNPLYDGEWTYTWQNGRQLASMTNGETTASFVYNENGLRVQKTVNGVVTDYTLHGKNIVHMKTGSDELHFFYDAQNKPAVVVFNGTPYSYVQNLQGDIVAILDSIGVVVVSYVYDAWGKPISKTGSMADTLGEINPFRYRSYAYDCETGLYYLRSRYYVPMWFRFLNSDLLLATGKKPSTNIFSYCENSPLIRVDPSGKFWGTVFALSILFSLIPSSTTDSSQPPELEVAPYASYGGGTGNVYIVNKSTADEIREEIGERDVIIIDYRTAEDPNMQLLDSYKIDNKEDQREIAQIMCDYNTQYPVSPEWKRTPD